MMVDREKSREQSAQELPDNTLQDQSKNFFFPETGGPFSVVSLFRLGLGILLTALGIRIFCISSISETEFVILALLSAGAGVWIIVIALRGNSSRGIWRF